MVVDIKRCIEEKIVIWCTTKKQAQQIWNDFHKYKGINTIIEWEPYSADGFEVSVCTHKGPEWQNDFKGKYFIDKFNARKCLDYEDVLLSKVYELW